MENNILFFKEKRVIAFQGTVTYKNVQLLRHYCIRLINDSLETLYLMIDTNGGDIDAALLFYDFIRISNIPLCIIVNGRCHSSGLLILASAQKENRFCTAHSTFLFHAIRISFEIENTFNEDVDRYFEIKKESVLITANHVSSVIKNAFDIEESLLKKLNFEGETYQKKIYAEEAVRLQLIKQTITQLPFAFP